MSDEEFGIFLADIVGEISLGMGSHAELLYDEDKNLYYVQIACWRKDVITNKMDWGFGGRAVMDSAMSKSQIVQAIFGKYKEYWEHEARETFVWRGRRVFGPHMDIEEVWGVANKVDIPSLRHKGE